MLLVDQTEIQSTYPNMSTMWVPTTYSVKHKVTTLLAYKRGDAWISLVCKGFSGQACGTTWKDKSPDVAWFEELGKKGPGVQSLLNRW